MAGGYNRDNDQHYNKFASVEVFDPASNTWDATKAAMTTGRWSHALAVLDGELHAVGGVGEGETFVEKFDPQANSWSTVPEMALPGDRSYLYLCAAVMY